LDRYVVGAGLHVGVDSLADRVLVAPGDQAVDPAVAALAGEVVVGQAQQAVGAEDRAGVRGVRGRHQVGQGAAGQLAGGRQGLRAERGEQPLLGRRGQRLGGLPPIQIEPKPSDSTSRAAVATSPAPCGHSPPETQTPYRPKSFTIRSYDCRDAQPVKGTPRCT
jgi:hypothetical protein